MNTQTKLTVLQAVDPLLDAIMQFQQALLITQKVIEENRRISISELDVLKERTKNAEAFILKFKNIIGNDLTTGDRTEGSKQCTGK